jgi:hypothetical protein
VRSDAAAPIQPRPPLSTGHNEGQAFTSIFIEDRQALQTPPIGGFVMAEIITPDVIGMRCAGRRGRSHPARAPLAHFKGYLDLSFLDLWRHATQGLTTLPP